MLQDLTRCDDINEELKICEEQFSYASQFMDTQKTISKKQEEKYLSTKQLLADIEENRDSLQIELFNKTKKLEKVKQKRNTFLITTLCFGLLSTINLFKQ